MTRNSQSSRLLPELPYQLPDGTVVLTVEDLEVGVARVATHLQTLQRTARSDRPEFARFRQAIFDLNLLPRVQGQKYDKRQAHSLLARAAEALADSR